MAAQEADNDKLEIDNRFLCGSTFNRVNLKDAVISDSVAEAARFNDVNAAGIGFENANLTGATFHNANLSDAAFDDVNLTNATIGDADITGMTINGILVSDLLKKWHAE